MVRPFAMTYPQFMEEALKAGYADPDLQHLKNAHSLALRMFDGFYRAQDVPLISHLVRTAGIVLAEKASAETVAASLLHSVYLFGRFRDGKIGRASASHRREVVSAVGERTESLVQLYISTRFRTPPVLREHIEKLPAASAEKKAVLLIILANELEDYLDLGMVFRGNYPYSDILKRDGQLMVELARGLGRPQLSSELEETFQATLASKLPESVKTHRRDAYELPEHFDLRRGRVRTALSSLKKAVRGRAR
jgi:(p)ppGpp synthase/HD superfamily hydrolase